jgi:hypothetical protein
MSGYSSFAYLKNKIMKTTAKTTTLVWVRWFDASYQHGECTVDELVSKVELESAGLLVAEDAKTVSLALDYYQADDTWRHIQHIPKVNVIRMKKVVIRSK